MGNGVPVVVCPGFADQPMNARKAEALGVGLGVPRPHPELGMEGPAARQYHADVARAMKLVFSSESSRFAALGFKEKLQHNGGLPRAVDIMVAAGAAVKSKRK